MRSAPLVTALVLGLAAIGPVATAAADPLPTGRIGILVGAKTGTGALAGTIGLGYAAGFEAGVAPMSPNQRIGWGASWSIVWSDYLTGSARVSDAMKMVELDTGLRLRVALGARKRQVLFLGGGAALVRTNEPLFEGGDRSNVGPWGSAGVEGSIYGLVIIAATLRYGVIQDGVGTLSLQLSFSAGQ